MESATSDRPDDRLLVDQESAQSQECCDGCWPFHTNNPNEPVSSLANSSQNLVSNISKDHTAISMPIPLEDKISMCVLLILYCLQGIPMGLSSSMPFLLKERNVSFESLAFFSLVSLPFSLKLLWAPLVDSLYCTASSILSLNHRTTFILTLTVF